jgi:alpha-amylase
VKNLPDIKTESNEAVELPPQIVKKWKDEGRYEEEVAELEAFFKRTGHPKAPRFYIMKWLSDYIKDFGIDGYRVDTVKHTEEYVWQEFKAECDYQFSQWKKNYPDKVLDDNKFYLVGEVYNYGISNGQQFDIGDRNVNYFENSFHSLINFELKYDSKKGYQEMFSKYSNILQNELKGHGTMNYLSSHDDGNPFDPLREKPFETANRLLLSPGTSQVYYGDEVARPLIIDGTQGDATLRSAMDWSDIESNAKTKEILSHWQKLGQFRANHPAVGAGVHEMLSQEPYLFSRAYSSNGIDDFVVVGLDLPKGKKTLDVSGKFKNGDVLHEAYSGQDLQVMDGKIVCDSEYDLVLLEKK